MTLYPHQNLFDAVLINAEAVEDVINKTSPDLDKWGADLLLTVASSNLEQIEVFEICEVLLTAGARPRGTRQGYTFLEHLEQNNPRLLSRVFNFMVKHHIEVEPQHWEKCLDTVFDHGDEEVIKSVCQIAKDHPLTGQPFLVTFIIAIREFPELFEQYFNLVMAFKPDPNAINEQGQTPLQMVCLAKPPSVYLNAGKKDEIRQWWETKWLCIEKLLESGAVDDHYFPQFKSNLFSFLLKRAEHPQGHNHQEASFLNQKWQDYLRRKLESNLPTPQNLTSLKVRL